VIVDSTRRADSHPDGVQPRVLKDGSEWEVYKRYFTGAGLAEELGGGEILHEGTYFVAVRA
jgi:hypothetical protein